MAIPTTAENIAGINKLVDEVEEFVANLYSRWQDEKQYENLSEYREALQKQCDKLRDSCNLAEFQIVQSSKRARSFNFNFNIGTEAEYQLYITKNTYGWKRLV